MNYLSNEWLIVWFMVVMLVKMIADYYSFKRINKELLDCYLLCKELIGTVITLETIHKPKLPRRIGGKLKGVKNELVD
jgi:hypothetical protein